MKKILKISLITFLIFAIIGSLFIAIFISNFMKINSVKFDKDKLLTINQEITIFNNNDEQVVSKLNDKTIIEIEEIPNHVINAFISIEDKKFFEHNGLNYKRIAKAMINNIKSKSFKEGASTISQQLIKNTHLTNEKTISRKLKEMLLTKKLEKEFSKKDILETYLNVIYFGENSYGIENASKKYFNKSAKNLTISEAATLAGIIKSPYTYSPILNKEKCTKRRNLVLSEMYKDGKITFVQYDTTINEPLEISDKLSQTNNNDLYIKATINEAKNILKMDDKELRLSGVKIYSYLDNNIQSKLQEIANNEENYHKNSYGNINDSALILIDNKNYAVVGFAGKSSFDLTNFVRQPGSAIKPVLVYSPALENGLILPDTLILDEEVNYNGYSPKNVGGDYLGYVSVKDSICKSLNVPAVKILDYVGIDKAKKFAENFGITFSKDDNGLALALGGFTDGINLKDLTNSYLPFANAGNYDSVKFVKKILDKDGNIIYQHKINENKIIGEDTAYLMTDMLKEATKTGTSKKLKYLPYDVAGKTGTVAIKGTNNNTDAYSVAYTTEHTMGVWIGNYSNKEEFVLEGKNNGGTFATNMINLTFEELYKNKKPQNFEMPKTVKFVEIDLKEYEDKHNIKLASTYCPSRYKKEILVSERYMPKETSKLFESIDINNFDVKLNKANCEISFDAVDYLKYEIVRVNNGLSKSLKKIENKNEKIKFIDNTIKDNERYDYYIKIATIDDNFNSVSETITIITPTIEEKFEKIYNYELDNNSWIFS